MITIKKSDTRCSIENAANDRRQRLCNEYNKEEEQREEEERRKNLVAEGKQRHFYPYQQTLLSTIYCSSTTTRGTFAPLQCYERAEMKVFVCVVCVCDCTSCITVYCCWIKLTVN
eukprot:m.236365 g.236365  ORF g.236365 m.236365 type:complete len:115 (+) comp13921_c1_seq11:1183-1527(+)